LPNQKETTNKQTNKIPQKQKQNKAKKNTNHAKRFSIGNPKKLDQKKKIIRKNILNHLFPHITILSI